MLSSCAGSKFDNSFRARVDSFSCPVGAIWNGTTLTVGVIPTWHYRLSQSGTQGTASLPVAPKGLAK